MTHPELPIGFGFALAQNPEAMQRFSALSESKRAAVLQRAHNVSSKEEMESLVREL